MTKKQGFTLIEALLALALGGFALMSATSLLVSLSRTWASDTPDAKVFEVRTHNIKRFFREFVEESIGKMEIKDWPSEGDEPLICFPINEPPPIFWSPIPGGSSQVLAYLRLDGYNLEIKWYSKIIKTETTEDGRAAPEDYDDYHTITLSEDADMEYLYINDEGELDIESDLRDDGGKYELPDALHISFESDYADDSKSIYLYLDESLPTGPAREPLQ